MIEHPVLGTVRPREDEDESYDIELSFRGKPLAMNLDLDTVPLEEVLTLAVKVVSSLEDLESVARTVACRDLLPMYNGGWNEYDEIQEDGSIQSVKKPELDDEEFKARLSIEEIHIVGTDYAEVWFDDKDLFWGNQIFVTFPEGEVTHDAEVELFG